MRKLLYAIGVPVLLFFSFVGFAQDKLITGRVTDSTGNGIANVSVTVKEAPSRGTTTAPDGRFSILVPAKASTLVFSSVGYAYMEIPISGNTVNAILQSGTSDLNTVVVVAYGTRRKGDLTGAVTSVTAKDFQKGNINSSEQLLIGKVAGLQVTTGGGAAGGGSTIRIRGGASLNASNDPLIVIDGVPVEGNGIPGSANLLNTINPNDIESISVLKDASATALYGSRASNGVLIITTKKGASGKFRFNYNTQLSSGIITDKVDVLNGDQIRKIINDNAAATGSNTFQKLLGSANTDWQDQIYQNAIGFDNNISASGSVQNIPIRASAGYLTQDGILKTNHFNRLSGALNLSPRFLNDYLSINVNLKATQTKNRFADEGAVGAAASFDPTQDIHSGNKYGGYFEWLDANGKPIGTNGGSSQPNPISLLQFRDNRSTVNRFIGNAQIDYKLHFFPDLHVLLNVGMDRTKGSGNDNIDSLLVTNANTLGQFAYYEQSKSNTLIDAQLFYAKDLKSIKSKIDVLVGHSYQDFYTEVKNFPKFSQKGDTIKATIPTFLTDKPQNRLESYIGRLNFTYNNKYLLTASVRRDASSRFSKDNRVGYFPAVALAWKLKEEFFLGSNAVSDLKLRLGWGQTGQQDGIDNYAYLPRYSPSYDNAQYQFGDAYYHLYRPAPYDENIKWESTTTTNIGLDFAFLNNRIFGSLDGYFKKTKDLLATVDVAPGSNFNISLTTNVGNIENKGVEFVLNTVPVKNRFVTWDFGFNVTYNETKVTNLTKRNDPNFPGFDVGKIAGGTGNYIGKITVGSAPYSFFVKKQVYGKDGNPIDGLYEDINRDGVADDQYLYKKPAPDVLLGINSQVSYKKWNLGVAFHGAFGNYLYNNYAAGNGVLNAIKDPQTFIRNASADYLVTMFNNQQYFSDYYIQNASFLRWDNINLGYNLGAFTKTNVRARLSATVQNVAVFTKYNGLDPENSSVTGIDNVIYPRPRIFSLGINLDF
ncbi:MAG: SusC/RagA family TonB-linked outer membrane protein [Flavisolibacter sp.]|nr:SusC/RagA family TonB-linked outer membrane protein [Flavisolibacter sp.]